MPPPAYNIIPGDWQSVEYAINDLCTRIITEDIPTSSYILVDGTRAFTGKVSGITPTADAHLSTKKYVDDEIAGVTETDPIVGAITGIVKANGAGVISAASAGTDYEVPLTFGDGLTRTVNDIDVDTTQNIAKLSNLTSNGFVKTSGGDGTLGVASIAIGDIGGLLSASYPLTYNSGTGALALGYNTTNLKLTANEIDTIQGISTAASPTFAGVTISGTAKIGRLLVGGVLG